MVSLPFLAQVFVLRAFEGRLVDLYAAYLVLERAARKRGPAPVRGVTLHLGTGLAVVDRLLAGDVDLLDGEQRHRPRPHRSARADGEADRSGRGVVGEVADDEDVLFAEREVDALDLAPHALRQLLDGRAPARATVLEQALGAFRRVRSDDHELGHIPIPFRARGTPFARVCRSACDRLAPPRAPPICRAGSAGGGQSISPM